MTVAGQVKMLDKKIKQNKAQYDLDRKAAKISALSFGNLDKYEYLTGEDLNYKPSTVEQAKLDYSPLNKFFNKGLKEENKKEGLLKRLKNIEDKNEEQLKMIGNKNANPNDESFNSEKVYNEIKEQDKKIDYRRFVFVGSGKHRYDFSKFLNLKDFLSKIFSGDVSLNDAKNKQRSLRDMIRDLDGYGPIKRKYKIQRKKYSS